MANNLGNTYQAAIMNWSKGTTFPSVPNTYIALFTVAPTNAGGGTEVTGGSYARVGVASVNWSAIVGNSPAVITNSNPITFPSSTASWGTIVAYAVMDAGSGGNIIFTGSMTSVTIGSGVTSPNWAAGIFSIAINGVGNTLQNAFLNWIRGTTFPAAPSNQYMAIFIAAPSNAGGGTEVTGGAYARVAVASGGWSALTGTSPTTISNSGIIDFGTATANWGAAIAVAFMDALTVGNLLYWCLITSTTINNGQHVTWPVGTVIQQIG